MDMIGGHMYYFDDLPTLRHNQNLPTLLPVDFDQIVGWANGHDWCTNGITLMICPPYATTPQSEFAHPTLL
ncbi:MAG: hypothetical protein F6K55_18880 [Moorea sp. SIO4A3]|nr:hypothetical protein [Moorena sp. SIO4A3]